MAQVSEKMVEQIAAAVSQVLAERSKGTACTVPFGMAAAGPAPAPRQTNPASKDNVLVQAGACRVGHATEGAEPHSGCETLAHFIDHTLLKPTATDEQVAEICRQARTYQFASVCINPAYIPLTAKMLAGSGVKVCTVIGFPLGSTSTETKAFETRDAVAKGADEIDMVIHIGKLKSGDFEYVCNDIRAVVQSAQGRVVKVIIETSLLTDDEKVAACILAKAAGAQFVKTSTGFGGGGATPEDIALMRRIVGKELGVKASGGVKDCESAEKLIAAGASRLGASASVEIVEGKAGKGSY